MKQHWAQFSVIAAAALMAATAGGTATPAAAQDPAALVLVRQDVMEGFGGRMKAIAGFIKEGAGTAEEAADRARQISIIAKAIPVLFPEGTSAGDQVPKNRAKPEIWQDWAKFEAAANNLSEEAAKLADVLDGGDLAAAGSQLDATGKNGCGGCHQSFRVPEDS